MSSSPRARLDGKVAVVTAATEGIGFAIAKRLVADGAKVVLSSRKQANVDKAVEALSGLGEVRGAVCHVGKAEDRAQLVAFALKNFGGIDVLVSNAAVSPVAAPILETPDEAWDKIFEVNVKAAWSLTKLVVPHMVARGGGSIVYTSSVAAFHPQHMLACYGVSKTALLGLTKAVAGQVAPLNIRVNCLCPGLVETKLSKPITDIKEVLDEVIKTIPCGRLGQPDEMAGFVSFLASDDSSYMTGECVAIGGGMQTRL